ncbi:MAG: hypothetical protein SF028_13570 [Candidatus Sumerlaeia bacterium]|nr:hypothetical protein [Candidatus Sumerlaeia bacterium]
MAIASDSGNSLDRLMPMKLTRKIRLDRIGSVTTPAKLGPIVEVSPECVAEEGSVIVGRVLNESKLYGEVELPTGRKARIVRGNLLVGALGARQALHGYMGDVPATLATGDVISFLNMAGVMGLCHSFNRDVGPPINLEVIGQVTRNGQALNIRDYGLPRVEALRPDGPPIVLVMGTCMNAGKTMVAGELIRVLSHAGVRIAAGKLSGVAALRDPLVMADNGAVATASFLDCGLSSTVRTKDLAPVARSIIAHLEESDPDLIILEMGDGIIGGYNVGSLLMDDGIMARTRARILCANDLVGAWGAVQYLEKFEKPPHVISGPVTDNTVGTNYVNRELKLRCANARNSPLELVRHVSEVAGITVELGA